jgi:hypothetical protein
MLLSCSFYAIRLSRLAGAVQAQEEPDPPSIKTDYKMTRLEVGDRSQDFREGQYAPL